LTSIPKGVYFLQTGGIFKRKLILNWCVK
jgi:hypothetical protein